MHVGSTLDRMTDGMLTLGDLDRGGPPDLDRLHTIAVLAPHLPDTNPLWETVVGYCTRQDAAGLFRERWLEITEKRNTVPLTDADTLASWALARTREDVNQRRKEARAQRR